MVMAVKTRALMTLWRIFSVIVVILISASRLSTFHPAITQQRNLCGIYQTLIVCLLPRCGCTWSDFSALLHLIWCPRIVIARERARNGIPLPHFTPWPTTGSAGVNVFANPLPARQNNYVFPPFVLIGSLLHYIFSQDFHDTFTLVIPDFHTRPLWWAPLRVLIVDCVLFGQKRLQFGTSFSFSTFPIVAPA